MSSKFSLKLKYSKNKKILRGGKGGMNGVAEIINEKNFKFSPSSTGKKKILLTTLRFSNIKTVRKF